VPDRSISPVTGGEVDIEFGAEGVDTANGRLRDARGRSENVKRRVNAAAAGAATSLVGVAGVSAQSRLLDLQGKFLGGGDAGTGDIASAGNGGVATASANGGAVSIADINSGGNAGNAIGVGDTSGSVAVDGGTVGNLTDLNITANGGTAIADASGGDYNLAFVS
jgi:hypothetical protein